MVLWRKKLSIEDALVAWKSWFEGIILKFSTYYAK